MYFEFGVKDTELTGGLSLSTIVLRHLPLLTSHNRINPSKLAIKSVLTSSEKSTEVTGSPCAAISLKTRPYRTSHSRKESSKPPEASIDPLGLKAMQ
jgi:hypothetical protein